jgi:putative lipoprotein
MIPWRYFPLAIGIAMTASFLTACSRAAISEDSQDFKALGQEPGWLLEIVSGKQITFTYDYGESKVVAPTPAPRTESRGAVRIYDATTASGDLRVEIDPTPCADVMSGQPFPATVTVTLSGRSFRGCGGPAK